MIINCFMYIFRHHFNYQICFVTIIVLYFVKYILKTEIAYKMIFFKYLKTLCQNSSLSRYTSAVNRIFNLPCVYFFHQAKGVLGVRWTHSTIVMAVSGCFDAHLPPAYCHHTWVHASATGCVLPHSRPHSGKM